MASHSAGVEPVARKIAGEVYRCYGRAHAGRIDLLYPAAGGTFGGSLDRVTLLPFAPREPRERKSAQPPLSNEPAEPLFTAIVQEHVFAVDSVAHVHEQPHRIGAFTLFGPVALDRNELDSMRNPQPARQVREKDERSLEDSDEHEFVGVDVRCVDFSG